MGITQWVSAVWDVSRGAAGLGFFALVVWAFAEGPDWWMRMADKKRSRRWAAEEQVRKERKELELDLSFEEWYDRRERAEDQAYDEGLEQLVEVLMDTSRYPMQRLTLDDLDLARKEIKQAGGRKRSVEEDEMTMLAHDLLELVDELVAQNEELRELLRDHGIAELDDDGPE